MSTVASSPTALTERQERIFCFIYESTRDKGFQPSIQDLCTKFGMRSQNSVKTHLNALKERGWIKLEPQSARCIRFLRRPDGSPFTGFADKEA